MRINSTINCKIQRGSLGAQYLLGVEVQPMNITQSATEQLEKEIEKAFARLKADEVRVSALLSMLKLEPIESLLFRRYKTWTDDRRMKFHPTAIIRSMLIKDLKCFGSYAHLVHYLSDYVDEALDLGFNGKELPSVPLLSYVDIAKIDDEIKKLMNFVVDRIRHLAKEKDKLLDIDFIIKKNIHGRSIRTVQRHKNKEGRKAIRLLRKEIFPELKLPLTCNARYCKENFLDLLAYVAYHNTYANQGHQLMKAEERFKGKVPHARTLLGYLAKLNKDEIVGMFLASFRRIVKIAKSKGLLKGEVDLAIDFTDWLYYGDRNDPMVIESKYQSGTSRRFRFATIKIVEKYGDLTLLALPMSAFTNEVKLVRTLIEFAKENVKIRYLYVDRGFYSTKYMNLFDELRIKYVMPAKKTSRVLRIIEGHEVPGVIEIEMRSHNKKHLAKTRLVMTKDREGETRLFVTNIPTLVLFTLNLCSLYKRRWGIETGYRVQKYEFRPNTTSKNYKIRIFYFMFSALIYNLWVITNAFLSKCLFGEMVEHRLITAKMFMKLFYEAYKDDT